MSSRSRCPDSGRDLDQLDDGDARDVRAATERLFVHETSDATVVYSGEQPHVVDEQTGRCSCADAHYRGALCKHLRRLEMERGERELPPVPRHRIDPLLLDARGEHHAE